LQITLLLLFAKKQAEGRIEWFKEHEINQIVANYDPQPDHPEHH
jgi:hypothetical protein